jgi:hypothetical protein
VGLADVVAAGNEAAEARRAGLASLEEPRRGEFVGDVLALVVIPLAVYLASSAVVALVSRVFRKIRTARPDAGEVEVVARAGVDEDLVVVVREAESQR